MTLEILQKALEGILLIGEAINNFFVFIFGLAGIAVNPLLITIVSTILLVVTLVKWAPSLPKLALIILLVVLCVMGSGIIAELL